jgi:hypothetical protein
MAVDLWTQIIVVGSEPPAVAVATQQLGREEAGVVIG